MAKPSRLSKAQDRALAALTRALPAGEFYLAGGTAVAMHLHHRASRDLDLFSRSNRVNLDRLREQLLDALPDASLVDASDVALTLRVGAVAVDVVRYPYRLLSPTVPGPHDVGVASLRDLAAMKLSTIASRGLKRDFWDLYEILHAGLTLEDAVAAYVSRYGLRQPDLYHLARALSWFEDAHADPINPSGLTPAKWRTIEAYFTEQAPGLLTMALPRRAPGKRATRRPG